MPTASCSFTYNETELRHFAYILAGKLKGNETILLFGTLGTGKTTFARALIQALCGEETQVTSPTFVLMQEYETASFLIYHYDLYRIKHSEELFEIGLQEGLGTVLTIIEWPETAFNYFPENRLEIIFDGNGDVRRLQLTAHNDMISLLESALRGN